MIATISPIRAALSIFLQPGQVSELRALGVGGKRAVCEVFADHDRMAARAEELDRVGAKGVYFTPNPLRPDLLGGSNSARKDDVAKRHWLLIDVDPIRPADCSSSDSERLAAWSVLDRCRSTLDAAGLVGAVVGDSGSGFHLCYPIDLPNDSDSQETIKAILVGLGRRCNDQAAQVDTKTFDAPRIWKLYGTSARKGVSTAERPHRQTRLIEGEPWTAHAAATNVSHLRRLLSLWQWVDDHRKGRPTGDLIARAKAYIAREPVAVSGQRGHDRTFHVACNLVKGFGLTEAEALEAIQEWNARCEPPWSEAELRHKLRDAARQPGPVGELANGRPTNGAHANGRTAERRANADNSTDPLDQDATARDLVEAAVTIRWGWPRWLPIGVLTVLASEPGVGKTRLCADLAKRVYLGLPWPDGTLPTYPAGSRTLWVPADNQHAELGTLPTQFGWPPESLYLNATRRNPFDGTMLDSPADLAEFEARIKRVQPAIVFVDTSLNATDRSAHKPEDAKAFFTPLQQIAQRCGVVMLLVTHLNAAGKPLGRRITGQARVVMQLETPDPECQPNRRKLYVVKSNSLFPPALGVTIGDSGNEYDDRPPAGQEGGTTAAVGPKQAKAREWLQQWLSAAPKKVGYTRNEAEKAGISARDLYRAKDAIGVEEFEAEGRKWWRLTETGPIPD